MLNPKLYKHYDKSVVDAFGTLATKASLFHVTVALSGWSDAFDVEAPDKVITDCKDLTTQEEVSEIFKSYAKGDLTEDNMECYGTLELDIIDKFPDKWPSDYISLCPKSHSNPALRVIRRTSC